MKVFISGKISENPNYKKDFKNATIWLKLNDFDVINPAEVNESVQFFSWIEFMEVDLKLIEIADAVYFLKNWQKSTGARIEHAFATALKKEIMYE